MTDVVERLIRYCEVPSQSDPLTVQSVPSTPKQFDMARLLEREQIGRASCRERV